MDMMLYRHIWNISDPNSYVFLFDLKSEWFFSFVVATTKTLVPDVQFFFWTVAAIYAGCQFWACKRLLWENVWLAILFVLFSYQFFPFATNGIRNGMGAAIVMLADTIEAAVRSMKDPSPKAIDQNIERLIRGKLEDGQLSDSPLTLKDIDDICEAFSGILRGVYHERIEYPSIGPNMSVTAQPKPVEAAVQSPMEQAPKSSEEQQKTDTAPSEPNESTAPADNEKTDSSMKPAEEPAPDAQTTEDTMDD